jgi:raffinose/stachyose/melibiose transport system permease protein
MFRYTKATAVREAFVWLAAQLTLMPFYFLVITALKPSEELLTTGTSALPSRPTIENFTEVLTGGGDSNILLGLFHSVVITAGSIAGMVILGSLAAYVLVRNTQRWGTITFYLFLVAIILPTQLGLIPLYVGARTLGLTGSMWGMIILYVGTLMPLAVFLYAGGSSSGSSSRSWRRPRARSRSSPASSCGTTSSRR